MRSNLLRVLSIAVCLLTLFTAQALKGEEKDPNRPPCTSPGCRKIKAFVKSRYCGKAPFGNGPDDGCEIAWRRKSRPDVRMLASFSCEWNEKKQRPECNQQGNPSPIVRALVVNELHLHKEMEKETNFIVLQSNSPAWTVVEASYWHAAGDKAMTCELVGIVDSGSRLHVLRKLPCQETDADVPTTTSWALLDVADVNGDGKNEIVLEGDAYEDHWFEVISVGDDFSPKTIFSGLGYYL